MIYGEVLYVKRWYAGPLKLMAFRYRFDPVPCVHKRKGWFYSWYKRPSVMNEKWQWFNSEGYGRSRRNPCNLPDPWDDYQRGDIDTRKSWKNKKLKRQWMKHCA